MELWHGSSQMVREPMLELCRPWNDYGAGFYCTPHKELACEWASREAGQAAFANHYEIDEEGLSVLDLSSKEYSVLNWLATLLENRVFQPGFPITYAGSDYMREHFLIDTQPFDLIRGWRADDSYFSFARAFINNQISVEQLGRAMKLGGPGIQVMVKSPKAFGRIKFIEAPEVDTVAYSAKRIARDEQARAEYREMQSVPDLKGVYLRDILTEEMTNDDPRLR